MTVASTTCRRVRPLIALHKGHTQQIHVEAYSGAFRLKDVRARFNECPYNYASMQATSATRSVTDHSWIRTTGGGSSRFASSPARGVEITLEQVVRTDADRLPMPTELLSTFGEQSKLPEF